MGMEGRSGSGTLTSPAFAILLTRLQRSQAVGCSIVFKPAENTPLSTLVRPQLSSLAATLTY